MKIAQSVFAVTRKSSLATRIGVMFPVAIAGPEMGGNVMLPCGVAATHGMIVLRAPALGLCVDATEAPSSWSALEP